MTARSLRELSAQGVNVNESSARFSKAVRQVYQRRVRLGAEAAVAKAQAGKKTLFGDLTRKSKAELLAIREQVINEIFGPVLQRTANARCRNHKTEIREAVADKGYHDNHWISEVAAQGIRTYIPEKKLKGQRRWTDKPEAYEHPFRANPPGAAGFVGVVAFVAAPIRLSLQPRRADGFDELFESDRFFVTNRHRPHDAQSASLTLATENRFQLFTAVFGFNPACAGAGSGQCFDMSSATQELIASVDGLPEDKAREVVDFARFLQQISGDAEWERIIADRRSYPKLEQFAAESLREGAAVDPCPASARFSL